MGSTGELSGYSSIGFRGQYVSYMVIDGGWDGWNILTHSYIACQERQCESLVSTGYYMLAFVSPLSEIPCSADVIVAPVMSCAPHILTIFVTFVFHLSNILGLATWSLHHS